VCSGGPALGRARRRTRSRTDRRAPRCGSQSDELCDLDRCVENGRRARRRAPIHHRAGVATDATRRASVERHGAALMSYRTVRMTSSGCIILTSPPRRQRAGKLLISDGDAVLGTHSLEVLRQRVTMRPGLLGCPRHGRHVDTGPLVVGTRVLVAQSGQTGITPYPAFVPTKRRSPRKETHLAPSAHIGVPMANTSQPRNLPASVA